MDSTSKNIFQQFLIEEFEKRKNKIYMDVVVMKRHNFNILLDKAHDELRNKLYAEATKNYYNIINFLKNDPYPDELQLSPEVVFSLKCCFCYSGLMSPERFKDEDINNVLLGVIQELNDKFRTRIFPTFLLVLLNFHRKNWLSTLTWCSEIANHDEKENDQDPEFFKELLPNPSEIIYEVEKCEEIAFFGYGENLTRNALLKPRLEKYKSWAYNLDDFIASRIVKLKPPVSELDLHSVFHHDIFPIWCLANGKECKNYYSDKFATKCTQCMRAKLYHSIPQNLTEDQVRFEKYVDKCAEFYLKFPNDSLFETMGTNNETFKQLRLVDGEVKKTKDTPAKKKPCSTLSQTDKTKTSSKHIQTEGPKTKAVEVQVNNNDSDILNAILEIKNKCLTLQEKKEDSIAKLNRKINELQEKINKDTNARKKAEQEFERKTANFKFEIQKLKEQLTECEKKQKKENEKNMCLQKQLIEQINDKYNFHKHHYNTYKKQAEFMVTYLKDLDTFLTTKSIPNDKTCKQNIEIWEKQLQKFQHGLEQLNNFYQNVRIDMINSDIYNITWPDLPEFPRYEDNLVFISFKTAIRNIIQTEEMLYWKYAADYQTQMQRAPTLAPINNFPYNVHRPQFPPQNNIYVGPRLVYSNTPAQMPVSVHYQPQVLQQAPKKERLPLEIINSGATAVDARNISEQNPRLSKSMEFLNKTGGLQLGYVQKQNQEDLVVGACAAKKKKNKKENEVGTQVSLTQWTNQKVARTGASPLVKKEDQMEKEIVLLDYVLEQCCGATEEEVTLALLTILEDNKGTLSNLSKERIVDDVKIILRMKKQAAWVTPKSPHVEWHNDNTENECAICFEEYSLHEKYTLPCQHQYHKECIKKWLRTSSVCPICRIHCVFDEEFPPLH